MYSDLFSLPLSFVSPLSSFLKFNLPLHYAVLTPRLAVVRLLVEANPDTLRMPDGVRTVSVSFSLPLSRHRLPSLFLTSTSIPASTHFRPALFLSTRLLRRDIGKSSSTL